MTTFGEKLAAARETRPTRDVKVILDADMAEEKARLLVELESDDGDLRLGVKNPKDQIRERLDEIESSTESIVTIRLTRLPGRDWAELTSRNPARVDVQLDRHYGYNIDAVTEAAARFVDKAGRAYAHRLDGDEVLPLADAEWDELYDVLSGSEVTQIRDAIWSLSEWEPAQRIQELVKASGAATRSVSK